MTTIGITRVLDRPSPSASRAREVYRCKSNAPFHGNPPADGDASRARRDRAHSRSYARRAMPRDGAFIHSFIASINQSSASHMRRRRDDSSRRDDASSSTATRAWSTPSSDDQQKNPDVVAVIETATRVFARLDDAVAFKRDARAVLRVRKRRPTIRRWNRSIDRSSAVDDAAMDAAKVRASTRRARARVRARRRDGRRPSR